MPRADTVAPLSEPASRPIRGGQRGCHPRLAELVERHRAHSWRRPPADHTIRAFQALRRALPENPGPLVLDAGCGTGASTRALAMAHPQATVLGVDRSAARLGRGAPEASDAVPNLFLVRADLVDFWRLARLAGWSLARHFLLYPNPYPKGRQVGRRWHAHPVFPDVVALGGRLELRTNWRTYAEEMALALACFGCAAELEGLAVGVALTPFERKYVASGHALWRLRADLSAGGA